MRRRWDGCFIRLLDGMLQAGALNLVGPDHKLRIPTAIRHLAISLPGPALLPGSEGALAPQLPHVQRALLCPADECWVQHAQESTLVVHAGFASVCMQGSAYACVQMCA